MKGPRILLINDDRALIESRRRLLEDCGATVFTARGSEEALQEIINEAVDLVLIDGTNVGLDHAEKLCGMVKTLRPTESVAMLIQPEFGVPSHTLADHVIYRSGPRKMLVEINEILAGRLNVDLWEGTDQDEDQDRSAGRPG